MADGSKGPKLSSERVARHRRHLASQGKRRLEVTVTEEDATLLKDLAAALGRRDSRARELRRALAPLLYDDIARTGSELVAFFQASPLRGEELDLERDKTVGRDVELP